MMKKLLLVFLTALFVLSVFTVTAFADEHSESSAPAETSDIAQEPVANKTVKDIVKYICDNKDLESVDVTVTSVTAVSDETSYIVINAKAKIGEEDVALSYKYDITAEEFIVLYNVNNSAIVYADGVEFNPKAIDIVYNAMERSKVNYGVNIFENFNPKGFVDHLKYMGLGMLGIFVVVGVVIFLTWILNTVTGKKKKV